MAIGSLQNELPENERDWVNQSFASYISCSQSTTFSVMVFPKRFWIMLWALMPASAWAQIPGNPENWCRNGFFPAETTSFQIGTLRTKAYFYRDSDDCPLSGHCKTKAYVIPKDQVIVSRAFGDYVCAWYEPKSSLGSETVGWLPKSAVQLTNPVAKPMLSRWIGVWRDGTNRIEIHNDGDSVDIQGIAFWTGLHENVHTGEISAHPLAPVTNILHIGGGETYECAATFVLVGAFMIVHDNDQCGGMNVRFDGVYQKATQ